MRKLSWGVLSTAKIAREKVIPPMQRGQRTTVDAIASRDPERARQLAEKLGIARVHASYEALLADPGIEAVYNPLPNHLHVEWTRRAAEAGKHVLCEKPIDIGPAGAEELIRVRDRTGVHIQEAFMVRTHPQWLKARELVQGGRIGTLRAIQGFFSYYLVDPNNIRNKADIGGGGLLDIGCYPINTSRFVTGREPSRVAALIDHDPVMRTDRLGSALLDYDGVQCSFVWSTQLVPRQTMQFVGDKGRLEVEVPFNAPNDRPCRLFVYDAADLGRHVAETIEIPTCDQYGIAGDAFSAAILDGTPQPVPLEDTLANMKVIDAVRRAGASGAWERP
ncbi:MAG: Gfo/Idh/MocA family oxidoreductase [Geminicoccaceae bacterium]